MKKIFLYISAIVVLTTHFAYSQEVDIENFQKVNFKISGGINANSVFYNSNSNSTREPFT